MVQWKVTGLCFEEIKFSPLILKCFLFIHLMASWNNPGGGFYVAPPNQTNAASYVDEITPNSQWVSLGGRSSLHPAVIKVFKVTMADEWWCGPPLYLNRVVQILYSQIFVQIACHSLECDMALQSEHAMSVCGAAHDFWFSGWYIFLKK